MIYQEYRVPDDVRHFRTELPVTSYGRCYTEVRQDFRNYTDLEVCVRLGDGDEYGIDIIDGVEHRTRFPHVILKHPGMQHRFRSKGVRDVRFFHYPAGSEAVLERYGMKFQPLIWPIEFNRTVSELWAEADRCAEHLYAEGVPEKIDNLFWLMMMELFRFRAAAESRQEYNEKKIRDIASYLHSHCSRKIDLARLAAAHGMSRRAFYLHWRDYYSVTPAQFILNQRIERAKFLLQSSDLPVAEIAVELQFCNSIYFIRAFRREVGQTPLRYRRECRER